MKFPRCPICDQADRTTYVSFDELEFVRCANCSVIYKSRERLGVLPSGFYEQSYFHGRTSGREKRFAHRARKAASWVSDAKECLPLDSPGRLLDVGCSLGYVLEGAHREGLTSAGVDISSYAVGVCKERGYEARVGTTDALPYDDATFDIVILKHVLEHTATPRKAMGELRRVLSSHGVVLIAVPDAHYWKGDSQRATYRYFRPDDLGAQHFVYYTVATLSRLLLENGFEVRFSSKAVFRTGKAARSLMHKAWEWLRFAALTGWVSVARLLRMQREIYLLARKVD